MTPGSYFTNSEGKTHVYARSDSNLQGPCRLGQKALDLSVHIYRLTPKDFPTDERYGLTAETRKTSRSIPYNIAEGH
jgi:hypothetical protein